MAGSVPTPLRLSVLLLGVLGCTAGLGALVLPALAPLTAAGSTAPDALVTAVAAAALAGCWLWALVTGGCYAVRLSRPLRGGLAAASGRTPRLVRVVVGLALGLPVLAPVAADADTGPVLPVPGASVSPSPAPTDLAKVSPGVLDGLPLPELPETDAEDRSASSAPPARLAPALVQVRPGDSLWSIAAGRLCPPDAPAAAVADALRLLVAANRDRLGPDPNLIFPGTRLVLPDSLPTREDHR